MPHAKVLNKYGDDIHGLAMRTPKQLKAELARADLIREWSRVIMTAGYAIDLPSRYLPHHLKFNNWRKTRTAS